MTRTHGPSFVVWTRGLAPILALGCAAGLLAPSLASPPTLAAAPISLPDTDGDGLIDQYEEILGTDEQLADTDGDGYSDFEEIARQSDPLVPLSAPAPSAVNVGMASREAGNLISTESLIFIKDSQILNVSFDLGVMISGVLIPIAPSVWVGGSRIGAYPGADPTDLLIGLEITYPQSLISTYGGISVYAKVTDAAGGTKMAFAQTLTEFSGVPMAIEPAPQTVQGGTGLIYRPLTTGAAIPPTWTSGQICWQGTTPVGTSGSAVVYEVDSSDCEQVDTYCSPTDCAAAVGGTVQVLDAAILVGG